MNKPNGIRITTEARKLRIKHQDKQVNYKTALIKAEWTIRKKGAKLGRTKETIENETTGCQ